MRHLLIIFSLCILFTSCSKEKDININYLKGQWYVSPNKGVVEDSWMSYTFVNDTLCTIRVSHAVGGTDTSYNRTYKLSVNNDLITLYNEQKRYTEQYKIVKLTKDKMSWINGSPNDGNSDKELYKSTD